MQISKHPTADRLHVIIFISNYARFKSRYDLYHQFLKQLESSKKIHVTTVEVVLNQRPHVITHKIGPDHDHLRLRTNSELWHKENAINVAIRDLTRRHPDWKYVAWVDADIEFVTQKQDWAAETIEQLQHYKIVQLFEDAIDLGPNGEVIQLHKGFVSQYLKGAKFGQGYTFWHPGFAWAMRREIFEELGGLLDIAILGAGDHHMALSMIEKAELSLPGNISDGYKNAVLAWQDRCKQFLHKNIGYIPGTIHHLWHGKKKTRFYVERWQILTKFQFNPATDLKQNLQGLWELTHINSPRIIGLRDALRQYFRARLEDSTDIE